jgi:hypothetical protein
LGRFIQSELFLDSLLEFCNHKAVALEDGLRCHHR